jgi:hypothetical protein
VDGRGNAAFRGRSRVVPDRNGALAPARPARIGAPRAESVEFGTGRVFHGFQRIPNSTDSASDGEQTRIKCEHASEIVDKPACPTRTELAESGCLAWGTGETFGNGAAFVAQSVVEGSGFVEEVLANPDHGALDPFGNGGQCLRGWQNARAPADRLRRRACRVGIQGQETGAAGIRTPCLAHSDRPSLAKSVEMDTYLPKLSTSSAV